MATESVELAQVSIQVEAATPPAPEPRSKRLRAVELVLVTSVPFAPLIFNSAWAYFSQEKGRFSKPSVTSLMIHEVLALAVLGYVLFQQRRSWRDVGITFKFADIGTGILLALGGAVAAAAMQATFFFLRPITESAARDVARDI